MNINITKKVINIGILFLLFTSVSQGIAQKNDIYSLGEKLVQIAESGNPDKIVDYVDDQLDLDQKALIIESYLAVKDQIFASMDQSKLHLFNVLKENGDVYFIVFDGNKFKIIKSKLNDNNKLIDHFAIVKNKTADLLKLGKSIYKIKCYSCHGKFAQGGIASNLTDNYWTYVNSEQNLLELVKNGKKGTMMIAFKDYLKPDEINAVLTYIKALQNKKQKNPKKPEGEMKNIKFSFFN